MELYDNDFCCMELYDKHFRCMEVNPGRQYKLINFFDFLFFKEKSLTVSNLPFKILKFWFGESQVSVQHITLGK